MATCSVAIPRTRGGRQPACTPESLPACPHPGRASARPGRGAGQAPAPPKIRDFLQQRASRNPKEHSTAPWESSACRKSRPCSCTWVGLMLERAFFVKQKKNVCVFVSGVFRRQNKGKEERKISQDWSLSVKLWGGVVAQGHPSSMSRALNLSPARGDNCCTFWPGPAGGKLLWMLTLQDLPSS